MENMQVIVFTFPNAALLEHDLAGRMEIAQGMFKDIPMARVYSIVGATADKVIGIIQGVEVEPSVTTREPDEPK